VPSVQASSAAGGAPFLVDKRGSGDLQRGSGVTRARFAWRQRMSGVTRSPRINEKRGSGGAGRRGQARGRARTEDAEDHGVDDDGLRFVGKLPKGEGAVAHFEPARIALVSAGDA